MPTYREAGVDTAAAARLVRAIGPAVTSTWGDHVVGPFGGFAAGVRLPEGYRRPVLMLAADGVGTKAEVARQTSRLDGLGFDLVAMCVDDLAAAGAEPLAMVDYLAVGALSPERDRGLVESVAAACREAGCALLGGETAEHPGVMEPDRFDLAGAALGVVEEGEQVTGASIRPGDRLLGLPSPNLRANGFSLVRSAVLPRLPLEAPFPGSSRSVAEVLLEPSVVYAPAVVAALAAGGVTGLAHVTGGGIGENLGRVLPEGCRARLHLGSWRPPEVFEVVSRVGRISREEMLATFNMGVGFVVAVRPAAADAVAEALAGRGHPPWELGDVVEGPSEVEWVR